MRWPFRWISPLVGPKRPLIRLNSVDLPAPFGPMMATRSPARTASSAPRMISVLPNDLRTFLNSTALVKGHPPRFVPRATPGERPRGSWGRLPRQQRLDLALHVAPAAREA